MMVNGEWWMVIVIIIVKAPMRLKMNFRSVKWNNDYESMSEMFLFSGTLWWMPYAIILKLKLDAGIAIVL